MSLSFPIKSVIYLIALVPMFFGSIIANVIGSSAIVLFVQLLALGVHIWMTYGIHNDAKSRGLDENWYLIQLITGPFGLAVYWIRILVQELK